MPTGPNAISRRLAVLGGVVVLTLGTIGSVSAASPTTFKPRDAGKAWDAGMARRTDQVIVTYKPGTTAAGRATAAHSMGLSHGHALGHSGSVVYQTDTTPGVVMRQQARSPLPQVESVAPDMQMGRHVDPTNEPGWSLLWGLNNTGQPIRGTPGTANVDIDALEAYGVTTGDPAVVVAVIDDGVDFSHPDLAARAWTNPGESGGGKETDGVDNDHNGYIDDVHGWDFCNDDNTVHDFNQDFHGTHVAGTIAASLDGQGVVGVAPNVKIMALKFLDDGNGCGMTSMAIKAIEYAKSFGVVISNNSWGGRGSAEDFQPLSDAIAGSGMLFVTSAGNDGIDNDTDPFPAFPASFDLPNVVTVAAADLDGGIADFSNFGAKTVDIAAPGVNILSALPADAFFADPGWGWLDGTSMASPHVTGVAALLASQNPAFRVSTGVSALRARLLSASKALPLSVGDTVTGRMIDARFALDTVAPTALAPNSHSFSLGSVLGTTTVSAIVGWPAAHDDASGVRNYTLEQQANAGVWTTAASGTTARTAARSLSLNVSYRFRVRAMDRAGNLSGFMTGPTVLPKLYQESTSLATYAGTWSTAASTAASGGHTRYATRAGASVSFRFIGRAAAVVAPKGSTRGSAKVYVDNVYAGTISLYRSSTASRVIVFARSWTTSGTHTIKLVSVGTSGHPRIDVDAFAILR